MFGELPLASDLDTARLGNQLKIMVLFYISRSVFKADRLTFGMHFVRGIMPEKSGAMLVNFPETF